MISYKFLATLTIAFFLTGNGFVMAHQATPIDSDGISMQQQSRAITGIITEVSGDPVIGASIMEKGTTNGTITDIGGRFTLNVSGNAVLLITYIGYKSQEVRAQPNMQITLREDSELLDEVVVVGYGSQKKANLTGAVASVDVGKTIDSRPIADIGRALQGAVPGLTVSTRSGEIGGAPTIKIRGGMGSPNGDSNPLILVDNVEITDLTLVNPDDIESISVLKDAASSSIYGARAAFGVILITTKARQRNEKVTVKYSNNFAWRTPTSKPTQLPGWQQAEINLAGVMNSSTNNSYTVVGNITVDQQTIDKMKAWSQQYGNGKGLGREMVYGRDFEIDETGMHFYRTWDWYDMYIKKWMPQQTHNVSVNGGNGRTNYGVTLGYLNQEGLTKINADTYERYNVNLTFNTEINKYISIRGNATFTKSDLSKPFNYNSELYDYLYYLYRWQPMYPYGTYDGKSFRSSLTDLEGATRMHNKKDYLRLGGGVTIKPIRDLTVDVDMYYTSIEARNDRHGGKLYGYDIFSAKSSLEEMVDSYGNYAAASTDYAREERGRTQMLTTNVVATYSKKIKEHDLKVMAGSNIEESSYRYIWAQKMGLLSQDKPELDLTVGNATVGSTHTSWAVAGFFGRANYSYKDRYLLEVNGRYDGSSRFPKNKRFAFFPSVSAGYRISEEAFMQPLQPVLSTLKLRASYGTVGNQDVGLNRFIETMSGQTDSWIIDGTKQTSVSTPKVVSRNLTWEKVKTIDVGLDVRFLEDKLGATFDWYRRTTSDILAASNLPTVLGADSPVENMGAMQTQGWELAVDFRHEFANGLRVTLGANVTDYQTKITKWNTNTIMPDYNGNGTGWYATASYYQKGMVLGDIWGLKVDRLLQESDFDSNGNLLPHIPDQSQMFPGGYQFAPGDVLYKDLDDNETITKGTTTDNPGDYRVIGNMLPRYEYGFSVGLDYKNFDFNIFFQGVGKRDLWAMGNQVLPGYTSGEPYYKGAEDYWRPDNTNAFYPRPYIYAQSANGNYRINDRYLLNMAYLRCKTLTVGYTLPKALTMKAHIQNLRVYFTGENLFEFSKVKPDIDPEIDIRYVGTAADNRNFGRSYPYQRTISFGLQLTL